jgi:radical SAM superfamily enzyme YgiQ (UPF0313 family)
MQNKFKMLFVYPNVSTSYTFSPAIEILSSVLRSDNHNTSLLHINNEHAVPYEKEKIQSFIEKDKPDLIGITATTFEFKEANEIAKWIKEGGYKGLVILGGIHATITPHDLESSCFDAFCIGEGELPLLDLVDKLQHNQDYFSTASFWFKKDNKIIKNPIREYLPDLNLLPFHDFDIMNTSKLLDVRSGWLSISFSRGCPFNCSFCINPLLRKINNVQPENVKKYLRMRTVDKVITELLSLIEKYQEKIKMINLDDDLILLHKKWALDFFKQFKEKIFDTYHIGYVINTRVDMVTDELMKLLKESGCHELKIGVESGNTKLRNDIVGKNLSREQIVEAFNIIHKYQLRTCAYFILGLPEETESTILDTIDLLKEIRPTLIRMTFLQPYEGTYLYDYCKEHNLFKGYLPHDSFFESPLNLGTIDDRTLLYYKLLMPWHLNKDLDIRYEKLLKQFKTLSYKDLLKSRPRVMQVDEYLSKEMTKEKKSHFKYFGKNEYYYEYKEVEK